MPQCVPPGTVLALDAGGLATQAGSEAVLPAYVAGVAVAGVFLHDRVPMDRLRPFAFALPTPFFLLRAGTLISSPGADGRLSQSVT